MVAVGMSRALLGGRLGACYDECGFTRHRNPKGSMMNAQAEAALNSFIEKLDAFLVDCARYEESGAWDTAELGYMSAYFEADLTGVVMQTMRMDGIFKRAEAEVFNRMFNTNYTPKMLRDNYRLLKPVIDDYCDVDARDALSTLAKVDENLCDKYRELILEACNVVSLSDGVAEHGEIELIERLRAALK